MDCAENAEGDEVRECGVLREVRDVFCALRERVSWEDWSCGLPVLFEPVDVLSDTENNRSDYARIFRVPARCKRYIMNAY